MAVSTGAFAEDPQEIEDFIAGIEASLCPRDVIERAEARVMALAYLRIRRAARFEAESINGAVMSALDENMAALEASLANMTGPDPTSEQRWRTAQAQRYLEQILAIASRVDTRQALVLDRAQARYRKLREREL